MLKQCAVSLAIFLPVASQNPSLIFQQGGRNIHREAFADDEFSQPGFEHKMMYSTGADTHGLWHRSDA